MKKRLIFTIIIFIVFQLLLSSCATNIKNDYVAIIDGEKISVEEFKVYLYSTQKNFESSGGVDIWETSFEGGKTAEDVAKDGTLNSISQVKISVKRAKEMNITLTEQEKAKALLEAGEFIKGLNEDILKDMAIDEASLSEIMEEKILYKKVKDEVTKNFESSEKDFELYYKQHINGERDSLIKLDIQYIYLSTYKRNSEKLESLSKEEKDNILKKAENVLIEAKSGQDFTELVKQYCDDKELVERNGREIISKGMHGAEFESAAFSLNEGEISDLITTEYGYCIIKLNDIIQPNEEEMKNNLRNNYEISTKEQIFNNEYKKWGGNIEKNPEIWDTIKIYR